MRSKVALEICLRVLQRYAVSLEKRVHLKPRVQSKNAAHLILR